MAAPSAEELAAVEARVWSLLDRYVGPLQRATIYGMPSVRWPGAKAHEYFAAVKPGKAHVGLYLLPADAYPEALVEASPAVLKRRTGKAAFTFPSLDDSMSADLADLLDRLFESYRADHEARPTLTPRR